MLDKSRDQKAIYQASACWHSKSLTTSRISTESYNYLLHQIKKHDCQQADKSFSAKQSSLISRSDESNWHLRSSARSPNQWSCHYVWITRINEYRLNSTWIISVWISWEILSLNKILQPILMWILWVESDSSALILILFDLILI